MPKMVLHVHCELVGSVWGFSIANILQLCGCVLGQ